MSGGSGNQGGVRGQFDFIMGNCRLIGGKTKLQQFDVFQQALFNAVIHFCRDHCQDVQSLISDMVEVEMKQPPMPDESLLKGAQKDLYIAEYQEDLRNWKQQVINYESNKSAMCSVVMGQCDTAMEAKLQVAEDWEAKRTDLLFVLQTAQAACIGVQDNHSMHVVAHEALRSFANCFQNNQVGLTYKQRFLACKTKLDKAGLGFKFTKKFLDKEKAKNSSLNDADATKAAENRFLGTFWLLNSDVDHTVTDNLVQAHISGNDIYPVSVEKAYAMAAVMEESSGSRRATSLAQTYEPGLSSEGDGRSSGGRGGQGGRGGPGRGAGRGGGQRPNARNRCHKCGR